LLDSLAGAGRVAVEVESKGKRSNVVEVVLLPDSGQGPFPNDRENETRSREIAAVAWVPNTSLVLVADENDDVVRVVDVVQRRVVRTIVLPTGASPVAVAVNAAGAFAAVAERERARVAIIDLTTNVVTTEVVVGQGPVSIVIAGNTVLAANQLDNTVSAFNLQTPTPVAAIPVQRAPRDIAVNGAGTRAYVTNQESGSISVIDVAAGAVVVPGVFIAAARTASDKTDEDGDEDSPVTHRRAR
jgi:YVTN family beta-propeller protein